MSELIAHRGGQVVTADDLSLVPVPETTKTFFPVPHDALAGAFRKFANDLLKGFTLHDERYALAREGQQMFGLLVYRNGSDEMGLSIGFRNAYDKSMAIGMALGANVFVCDNLALRGDIVIMRKHTMNVWKDLEAMAIGTIYKANENFHHIIEDANRLKQIQYTDDMAFEKIGWLYGNDILTPRQLPIVKNEWLKPAHPEFEPRNAWSFYNAVTESLKSCAPSAIMEKHTLLHNAFINN